MNKKRATRIVTLLLLSTALAAMTVSVSFAIDAQQGVYEYVVQNSTLSFNEAAAAMEQAIETSSFRFVGKLDQTPPEQCGYQTRVYLLYDPDYAHQLLQINEKTGAYAVVDRINLFQDENGLHVSIVNPMGINRTVLLDDTRYNGLSEAHRLSLREMIAGAIAGNTSEKHYGPIRKKGKIGKTMGVMAGGPFDKKIENVLVIPAEGLQSAVDLISAELNGDGKWGLKPVFSLILEDEAVAILGISSPAVESKSFAIVKAGGDKSRKELSCPGIAHAGAYPLEIVIHRKETVYWVRLVDAMFRMKMYFEDAGKMSFAKNMGMPGSIEREMKEAVKRAFGKE